MPTLAELIAGSLNTAYATAGVAAVYRSKAGAETPITVIPTYGQGDQYKGADAPGVNARIRIRASEIVQAEVDAKITITDPNYGDGSAVVWRIIGKVSQSADGLEWIVDANKVTK